MSDLSSEGDADDCLFTNEEILREMGFNRCLIERAVKNVSDPQTNDCSSGNLCVHISINIFSVHLVF